MSSISVNGDDKDWFDEFKESGETQAEAFSRLVKHAKAYNGELIDEKELAEELKAFFGSAAEVGAYRGTKHYMEDNYE